MDVVCIVILLVVYFGLMFIVSFYISKVMGVDYVCSVVIFFIVIGNNFELVIVVVIVVFGLNFGQVFAGVIGFLVEVLVLIVLVNVVFWF